MKLLLVGCVFVAVSCGARVDHQSLRHQPREFLKRTPGSGILQVHHGVHFAPLSLTRRQDAAAIFTGARDGFSQRDKKQEQAVIHFSQPRHDFFLQRHQDLFSNIQGANRRQFSQPHHEMLIQRQQDLNRAQISQFQQEFRPQFSQRQQERFTQRQEDTTPQFSQRQQQISLRQSQEARPQFLQRQQNVERFQVSQNQQEFRPQSSQRRQEMFSQRQKEFVPQFSQRHQDIFSQQQEEVRSQFSGQRQEPRDQSSMQPQEILSQFQQESRDRFSQHQQELRPQLQVFSQRQHDTRQFSEHQQNMQLSQQQQERRPQFSQQEQERRSKFSQQEQERRSQFSQQQEQERSQFSQQHQERRSQFSQQEQKRRSQFSQQQQERSQLSQQQQQEQGQQQQERRSQFTQQQQERRPQSSQQRQEMSHQQTLTSSPNLVNIEGSSFQFQFGQSLGSRRDQTSQSLQQRTALSTLKQDTPRPAAFHSQQQGVAAPRSDERQHTQQLTTQLQTRQPHFATTKMQDKMKKTEMPANIQTTQMQVISGHIESNVGSIVLGVFRPFFVPRSATLAEGQVSSTFKCSQYGQGHFTDRESDCRMFHVCTPVKATREAEATHHYRFTFRCGESERFDEASASCLRSDSCPASSLTQRHSSSSPSPASARLFMDFPAQTPKPADVCYLATDFIITGVRRK